MQQLTEAVQQFAQAQIDGGKETHQYRELINAVEAPYLACMMIHCHGNQVQCARALGINRATLRVKLRRHGLI